MTLALRPAEDADVPAVARMNRELIEDEGHRNPMTVADLEQRARGFLREGGWRVDLILSGGATVGFATWREEDDITEPSGRRVYLRQFYICRSARGGGLGRRAFEALMAAFPADTRILLEVLSSNPGGQAFWARMGFSPYALFVERRSPGAD
jgi:GNAT superfamily N-acetyltransferase